MNRNLKSLLFALSLGNRRSVHRIRNCRRWTEERVTSLGIQATQRMSSGRLWFRTWRYVMKMQRSRTIL
jgi:hypothetical protein